MVVPTAMSPQFTDDDIGKTVVNANGDDVGIVADVEHGTAHVEPDPGITDTIKAKLGWGGTDEAAYPLQEDAISQVTDDAVHLESDLSGSGGTSGMTDTGSTGTDTGATGTSTGKESGIDDDDELIGDDDDTMGDDEGLTDDDELIGDDDDDIV
ncbi:hypothetical protein C490_12552 [Natronobacterium gregoryi SP2]|uniref:PRC-barrel domain-containing protein n=2 Tax=Natronobacterium gregoryi TaxID=44930 RepID=L9XYU6_NATGS|nr:hypothetical protein C490_12552 [Natronobacterium gregoryi SP2]